MVPTLDSSVVLFQKQRLRLGVPYCKKTIWKPALNSNFYVLSHDDGEQLFPALSKIGYDILLFVYFGLLRRSQRDQFSTSLQPSGDMFFLCCEGYGVDVHPRSAR